MVVPARKRPPFTRLFERHEALFLTVALTVPIVALDQFLHTSPAQFSASSSFQVFRLLGDALIAMPLVAAAIWAGHLIGDRAGLGSATRLDLVRRALLISGVLAVLLIPGWFIHNEIAGLTQSSDLVASHSHAASHNADSYWVADKVVYSLLLAPLVAAAGWVGYRAAGGLRTRLTRGIGVLARSAVVVTLVGAVTGAAWFLHQAANRADSSKVLYTTAAQSALVHSHAFFAKGHGGHLPSSAPPVTAAPFSFAYQIARAFQDGVIAQAIGLPVAVLVLLWGAWLLRDRDRNRPEGPGHQEVVAP